MGPILQQLRDRRVIPWILAYLAVAWGCLQGLQFLAETYAWPAGIVRGAPVVAAGGLLTAVALAWFHGGRGRQKLTTLEGLWLAAILVVTSVSAVGVARRTARPDMPEAAQGPPKSASLPSDPRHLAVLPFANLGGDTAQEYFADGITRELINALAGVAGLRVTNATSSFAFKGKAKDLKAVAARLGVASIVDGSVRRSGDRVRIDAALVDARDGSVTWSHAYDRSLSNILAVQEEIARAIAAELSVKLMPVAQERATSPEAYDAYLRGRALIILRTKAPVLRGVKELKRAVTLDPDFAQGHSALARGSLMEGQLPKYPDSSAAFARARREARRALQLDSTLAEPHEVLGWLARDPARQLQEFDVALRLNPNSHQLLYSKSLKLALAGDRAHALPGVERMLAVDPLSPEAHFMAATVLNHCGQYARADSVAALGARLDTLGYGPAPADWPRYWNRGFANLMLRNWSRAAEFMARMHTAFDPADTVPARATGEALAAVAGAARDGALLAPERERVLRTIRQRERFMGPIELAALYMLLDERGRMYELLEANLGPFLTFSETAVFDPVRREPRFIELKKKAQRLKKAG